MKHSALNDVKWVNMLFAFIELRQ